MYFCDMQDWPIVFQTRLYLLLLPSDFLYPAMIGFNNHLEPSWIEIVFSDMNINLLDKLLWVKEMQWKAKMDITSRISFYIDNMTKHFGFLVTSYDKMHLLFWKCLIWEMYQGDWEKLWSFGLLYFLCMKEHNLFNIQTEKINKCSAKIRIICFIFRGIVSCVCQNAAHFHLQSSKWSGYELRVNCFEKSI